MEDGTARREQQQRRLWAVPKLGQVVEDDIISQRGLRLPG